MFSPILVFSKLNSIIDRCMNYSIFCSYGRKYILMHLIKNIAMKQQNSALKEYINYKFG